MGEPVPPEWGTGSPVSGELVSLADEPRFPRPWNCSEKFALTRSVGHSKKYLGCPGPWPGPIGPRALALCLLYLCLLYLAALALALKERAIVPEVLVPRPEISHKQIKLMRLYTVTYVYSYLEPLYIVIIKR